MEVTAYEVLTRAPSLLVTVFTRIERRGRNATIRE
jgi:hypothetical protein